MKLIMKDYFDVGNTRKTKPKDIKIKYPKKGDQSLSTIESTARSAAQQNDSKMLLIAWWDNTRRAGGPHSVFRKEVPKWVRDYATSRGAEVRVLVNRGKYEFFYLPDPEDHEELDAETCVAVHREMQMGMFENLQGG